MAEPDITAHPVDVVLILDRSRSMAGSPLANLKNGAKAFIDIIDEATDSAKDGQIGLDDRPAHSIRHFNNGQKRQKTNIYNNIIIFDI